MRALGVIALLLVVVASQSGCGEDFKPETVVEGLRVLGIRSDPAELAPGESAVVQTLVVDPSAPNRRNTLVWLSCDPDPLDLGRSACSDFAQLEDPTSLASSSGELPPGMRFAGFGDRAFYTAPADLFAALPEDDVRRRTGAVAQLLLMAIAEEVSPAASPEELDALLERVRSGETPSIVSLFRIRVTEQTPRNQNPDRFSFVIDGVPVPEFGHAAFRPGEDSLVEVTAPEDQLESFEQLLRDGAEQRTEKLLAAPYSTGGRFFLERLAVNEGVQVQFTPPGEGSPDPAPEPGRGRVWIVVRDTRGGQAWREHRLHLCEPPAQVPSVTRVSLSAGVVSLEGEHLEEILDVVVDASALRDASYSAALERFEGVLPTLAPGTYEVTLRTRSCVQLATGHALVVE